MNDETLGGIDNSNGDPFGFGAIAAAKEKQAQVARGACCLGGFAVGILWVLAVIVLVKAAF